MNLIPKESQSDVALSGIKIVAQKANPKILNNDDNLFVEVNFLILTNFF